LSSEFDFSGLQPDLARSRFVSLITWVANDDLAGAAVLGFDVDADLVADGFERCASTRDVLDGDDSPLETDSSASASASGSPASPDAWPVACGTGPVSATVLDASAPSSSSERPTVATAPRTITGTTTRSSSQRAFERIGRSLLDQPGSPASRRP
jgi:hypothetical protein